MIVAVVNQKGGVGKTTLALNLAGAFAREKGANALVVDADPQESALRWADEREAPRIFDVIRISTKTLHRDLREIVRKSGYTHVFIDAPPRVDEISRSALVAADLVLIPIQPSPQDIWAAEHVVGLYNEVLGIKEDLRCAFVLNRVKARTAIARGAAEALGSFEIPILKTRIADRVVFAESMARGLTVLEAEPSGAAARETIELAQEVWKFGGYHVEASKHPRKKEDRPRSR
jgi:chromosome partitioning protein